MLKQDKDPFDRQLATNRYLRLADTGTVASIVLSIADLSGVQLAKEGYASDFSGVVQITLVAAGLTLFFVLPMLFKKKLRDEYLEGLWNAGTSAAFIVGIAWAIVGGALRGATRNLDVEIQTGFPKWVEIVSDESLSVAILAFFIAFQIKRWRDR